MRIRLFCKGCNEKHDVYLTWSITPEYFLLFCIESGYHFHATVHAVTEMLVCSITDWNVSTVTGPDERSGTDLPDGSDGGATGDMGA